MDVKKIESILSDFYKQRNWNSLHSPKNLVMALSVESSELVEIFQWLSEEQSRDLDESQIRCVKEEVADVAIYLLTLCSKLNINLETEILEKIDVNREKYPI